MSLILKTVMSMIPVHCSARVKLWYGATAEGYCILEKGHSGPCYHPKMHKPDSEESKRIVKIPCQCRSCREKNAEKKA